MFDPAVLERLRGRRVIASTSGGKDSSAVSLVLNENGIEHDRVHFLTGWDHPYLLHYVLPRDLARAEILKLPEWTEEQADQLLDDLDAEYGGPVPLQRAIGPITVLRPPLAMPELILKKGIFPNRTMRFCTEELKIFPLFRHLEKLIDAGDEILNVVGIRAEESDERETYPEWDVLKWKDKSDQEYDADVWRPLIGWTEERVIEIHTRYGLRPCKLYLDGASRVGCWPCIFNRKAEIRMVADRTPWRIRHIRSLEGAAASAAHARAAAKGEQRREADPAFFQAPVGRKRVPCGCVDGICAKCKGEPKLCKHCKSTGTCDGRRTKIHHTGSCWPIDKVVNWSRTARGGRQFELFAPTREAGCMRWGLCDTGGKPHDDER
jgi:3'-phosphoadenosine 5'-phosphosulfate sulfotransferase (PAPS reductase)/FAD synthetase